MLAMATVIMATLSDPVTAATRRAELADRVDDVPEAVLRPPESADTAWELVPGAIPPPPTAGRLIDRLGVDAVADERQSLRLGIAPPGRRRPLLGIHYRLTLDD